MTNNDILRRLRFTLDQTDAEVRRMCASAGVDVASDVLFGYLQREGEPGFVLCPDRVLEAYLDGLVLDRRGPPDPTRPPPPAAPFDNTAVLRKVRIALELKESDMLRALSLGGMTLSASELGALFRNRTHKHFRPCGDQLLRNFLKGLTILVRGVEPGARG